MLVADFTIGYETVTIYGLTQWDKGQKLQITGIENLPTTFQVHFANYTLAEAIIISGNTTDGVGVVDIPNSLLEQGVDFKSYVYVYDADSSETIKTIQLPVVRREKPSDFISVGNENQIILEQVLEDMQDEIALKANQTELNIANTNIANLSTSKADKSEVTEGYNLLSNEIVKRGYYPFDTSKGSVLADYNTNIPLGTIRYLKIYNANIKEYDYGITEFYSNSTGINKRNFRILRYTKGTTIAVKTIYNVSLENTNGNPQFVESFMDKYNVDIAERVDIIIDWSKTATQKWDKIYMFSNVVLSTDSRPLTNEQSIIDKAILNVNVECILPSKFRVCGGTEMNIYYQNIIRYFNAERCHEIKPTTKFSNYNYFARWTPSTTDSTTFSMAIQWYINNTYSANLTSKYMSVSPIPKASGNGLNKKVLFIGDSTTDAGIYTDELTRLFGTDVMDIQLLGTRGTASNLHEGRSGWRAYTYVNCADQAADYATWGGTVGINVTNPFYNSTTGIFDFTYYMTQQGYSGVDYVFICLGTNDIARGNHQTDTDLKTYFDAMINSIKAYNANIKIALWLPPTRSFAQNRDRWAIDTSLRMNKFLIENYDNKENENIYLVPVYFNVDPYYDYNYSTVHVSARNPNYDMIIDTDNTHPSTVGYYKIADVIYGYIKYFGSLGV